MGLLALERMRIIDATHAWANSTCKGVGYKQRHLTTFSRDFGLPPILQHHVETPPYGPSLPIMWAMEHYTLCPSRHPLRESISFNTARSIRSAASVFYTWDFSLCFPDAAYHDRERRLHGPGIVSPTDSVLCSLTVKGMAKRLGTAVTPSTAILFRHVLWNQQHRLSQISSGTLSYAQQYCYLAANIAELLGWLGWLRSGEIFGIEWEDVAVVPPSQSASLDLPPNSGAVLLRLLESTKSDQTKPADLVLAYHTATGLLLGPMLERLHWLRAQLGWVSSFVFIHPDQTVWTSRYFKEQHLWPLLHLQQLAGDAFLQAFDGSPGNSIRDKFWSLHCYRRGGRSFVSKRHVNLPPGLCPLRRATGPEVLEHGRWRGRYQGSEAMPLHYQEWPIEDRLFITLLCM